MEKKWAIYSGEIVEYRELNPTLVTVYTEHGPDVVEITKITDITDIYPEIEAEYRKIQQELRDVYNRIIRLQEAYFERYDKLQWLLSKTRKTEIEIIARMLEKTKS